MRIACINNPLGPYICHHPQILFLKCCISLSITDKHSIPLFIGHRFNPLQQKHIIGAGKCRAEHHDQFFFFIGLFVVVGGLEQTGVLVLLANLIGKICGGNLYLMVAIIVWVSAVASAFIDNIPFAATMIPVINSLAATQGVDLSILAWSLAMGTDIGGSATPIGASANVVGVATAAKSGHIIKWGRYCKAMVPATVIVMIITTIMICVRYVH